MRELKNRWLMRVNGLLGLCIMVLGFSGCHTQKAATQNSKSGEAESESETKTEEVRPDGRVRLMYGVPPAEFRQSGE